MTAEESLIYWIKGEFVRRTIAVKKGTADISWIVPEYRISFTEVVSKAEELGVEIENMVDFRLWLGDSLKF